MSNEDKRTTDQVLAELGDDLEIDRQMAKIDAMSDAELDAELAKRGGLEDPGAHKKKYDALRDKLLAESDKSNVRDIGSAKRARAPAVTYGTITLAAIAATVALMFGLAKTDNLPEAFRPPANTVYLSATGGAPPDEGAKAKKERYEAFLSYTDHDYNECLAHLAKAETYDPSGESKPGVKEQRRMCTEALAQQRDH